MLLGDYIARPGQQLSSHLENVSLLCGLFAGKIGIESCGQLIGYLHDAGKYGYKFQRYIYSVAEILTPEDETYLDPNKNRGHIDHSTAGAQWIWKNKRRGDLALFASQILAICIASHHGGLIDCLCPEGETIFLKRINKDETKTYYIEANAEISHKTGWLEPLFELAVKEIEEKCRNIGECSASNNLVNTFDQGLLTRFLLSCLIDADRLDSAKRINNDQIEWTSIVDAIESKTASFDNHSKIGIIRETISNACKEAALRPKGAYLLTVPTGGGKTLSSLRFALHHAKKHCMERIIYIVPYTSIIEQNAEEVRLVLKQYLFSPDGRFSQTIDELLIEHHSNLTPDKDTETNRLLSENWDAPIVFTTGVQFLEALFGSGTRGVRRLHRLSNSVLIFDEPQSMPLKVIHLLNNALNFLKEQCNSTLVLCTATQPILHKVSASKGALKLIAAASEIVPNKEQHFDALRRVSVFNNCKPGGYSNSEISNLISGKPHFVRSILFIANTKSVAREVFLKCEKGNPTTSVFHLSTNMCPAHRQDIFDSIKSKLSNKEKVICICTQLIEAGVDISFESVIRSLAGLDSIAQAAGRCNRHGEFDTPGEVFVLNPNEENLSSLPEIRIAQEKTERVFREFEKNPSVFEDDLIGLKAIERYYDLFFFERAHEMVYPVKDDSLLSQLSENRLATQEYQRRESSAPPMFLRQSFATAGKAFEVIDAPTEGVVVPYNENARSIIGELCSQQWDPKQTFALLKKAQRYSVNIFSSDMHKLIDKNALHETQKDSGIYHLNEKFYSETFGISVEGRGKLSFACT